MSTENKPLSVPSAIIIAAVIVAVGIVIAFTGGKSTGTTQPTNETATRPTITEAAKKLGLNVAQIELCVENEETLARVEEEAEEAAQVGAQGTPYSVLVGPEGQTTFIIGAQPRENWDQAIDALLSGEEIPEQAVGLSGQASPVDSSDHIRGNINAPVTIIEYADIDCVFCQRLHPTLVQLLKDRPDDVRWVYRNFPITSLHPEAMVKAQAAECVSDLTDNETYWKYLELLMGTYKK